MDNTQNNDSFSPSAHKLVIAEKNSVAKAIAAVLGAGSRSDGYFEGNGWLVSWCVGHLVELADTTAYGLQYKAWRREDLPILPERWQYTVRADKKKQYGILRRLMNDKRVDTIVNACDAGREGELIFRLVYGQCGCAKPIQRLWISSMEDAAIRDGFRHLRPGAEYEHLHSAALCRAQADWLVGINATRLFSILYGVTLNVGRVMTPTLALMVRREADISGFQREVFYTVELDAGSFTAGSAKIKNKPEADAIRAACKGQRMMVRSVDKQEKTAAPPKLYDLTTLQRDANRLLGYTAQQTLDYTQALYEKKLATYPRTDSRFLTENMQETVGAMVNWLQVGLPFAKGVAFTPDLAPVIDNSQVSDHHALAPTMEMAGSGLDALPSGEREVLMLIAARLLCATAPVHRFETVVATIECGGHTFTAKGKSVLQDGWKVIDQAFRATLREKQEEPEDGSRLPELSDGQTFDTTGAAVREGFTAPPKHFTEDLLLSAMENAGGGDEFEQKGLGTPATRAATIEKLVRTGLVQRKKRQLLPTEKGVNLIAVLPETINSPRLTAEWEHRLGQVERGELAGADFMNGITDMVQSLIRDHNAPSTGHAALFAASEREEVGRCPRCGGAVQEGKKGFFCGDRACGFALWKDNRFFASKHKKLDKKVAAALLKNGRVQMTGLHSAKTGKTYNAAVILLPGAKGDKYVNFKLEFEQKSNGGKKI